MLFAAVPTSYSEHSQRSKPLPVVAEVVAIRIVLCECLGHATAEREGGERIGRIGDHFDRLVLRNHGQPFEDSFVGCIHFVNGSALVVLRRDDLVRTFLCESGICRRYATPEDIFSALVGRRYCIQRVAHEEQTVAIVEQLRNHRINDILLRVSKERLDVMLHHNILGTHQVPRASLLVGALRNH